VSKGKEQKARIEFAPYQKVPHKTKKRAADSRENTILEDVDYLKFVETINEPVKFLPSAEEQLDKRLAEEKEREANGTAFLTTPLLEYLKLKRAQKSKRGDRAERRKRAKDRGPKDITAIAVNPNKKTDEKKKERGPRRKSDREERRKRKEVRAPDATEKKTELQITILKDKTKKDVSLAKPEEGDKQRGKNGSWQLKKPGELGFVAIQQREPNPPGVDPQSGQAQPILIQRNPRKPQVSNAGNNGQPGQSPAPNNAAVPRKTNTPRRGGGGGRGAEVKVYAPKIQQAPVVAARNGP